MIHLAHARNRHAAEYWIRRRRRQIAANPVPLLVISVSEHYSALQRLLEHAGVGTPAFYMDASATTGTTHQVADNILLLADRGALDSAGRFMAQAHEARQRLDILLVEDVLQPNLGWCQTYVDSFEALA